jgi:hypothetical protein
LLGTLVVSLAAVLGVLGVTALSRTFKRPGAPIAGREPISKVDMRRDGARLALGVVVAGLDIATVRSSVPLNPFEIVVATLVAIATWLFVRTVGEHAQLPEPVAAHLAPVGAVAGIVAAVLLAGQVVRNDGIYSSRQFQIAHPTTTFVAYSAPGTAVSMPDVVGLSTNLATQMLSDVGLIAMLSDATNPTITVVVPDAIVVHTEPAAGTVVPRGTRVVIYSGGAETSIPTASVVLPATSPATTTPATTTFAAIATTSATVIVGPTTALAGTATSALAA